MCDPGVTRFTTFHNRLATEHWKETIWESIVPQECACFEQASSINHVHRLAINQGWIFETCHQWRGQNPHLCKVIRSSPETKTYICGQFGIPLLTIPCPLRCRLIQSCSWWRRWWWARMPQKRPSDGRGVLPLKVWSPQKATHGNQLSKSITPKVPKQSIKLIHIKLTHLVYPCISPYIDATGVPSNENYLNIYIQNVGAYAEMVVLPNQRNGPMWRVAWPTGRWAAPHLCWTHTGSH